MSSVQLPNNVLPPICFCMTLYSVDPEIWVSFQVDRSTVRRRDRELPILSGLRPSQFKSRKGVSSYQMMLRCPYVDADFRLG